MRHRRTARPRRGLIATALTAVLATVSATFPAHPSQAGTVMAQVISTTVVFPTGERAPGAELRLLAQPDPIWPGDPDEQVQYQPDVLVTTALADAAGRAAFEVPETPSLVELAHRQGGQVKGVLTYTAQRGTSEYPAYFKGLKPLVLTINSDGAFNVPNVSLSVLHTLPEFDATVLTQLGEKTIADVGTLVDSSTPDVRRAIAALDEEMTRRGYLFDNEAVAYNVSMMNGTVLWVTHSPETLLVRESPDADVYDVVGVTTGGYPMVDTTDEGDAVEDVVASSPLAVETAKKTRGAWGRHHGDCYYIAGPANADSDRYHRTVCYQVDHQSMDTVKGTSFWQYKESASGTALAGNKMERIWVHGQKYGHGTADPKTDQMPQPSATEYGGSSCTTKKSSIYVESGAPVKTGLSWEWTKTVCNDAWHGPVIQPDGEHAAEWQTTDPVEDGHVRDTALVLGVRAPTKEGSPVWNILSGQWVRH